MPETPSFVPGDRSDTGTTAGFPALLKAFSAFRLGGCLATGAAPLGFIVMLRRVGILLTSSLLLHLQAQRASFLGNEHGFPTALPAKSRDPSTPSQGDAGKFISTPSYRTC
jgi:hypothetical protein